MALNISVLKETFINLSYPEQLDLFQFFQSVLSTKSEQDDFVLSPEWEKEIEKREENLKNGTATSRPVDDFFAEFGL